MIFFLNFYFLFLLFCALLDILLQKKMDNWNKQNWIKNILSKSGTEIEKVNGNFIKAFFFIILKSSFNGKFYINCSLLIIFKKYSFLFVKFFFLNSRTKKAYLSLVQSF